KSLPDLISLGAWRSVYSMVAKYVQDERLRIVLSFHPLLIGGNPFKATSVYCLIAHLERQWGVHFVMGGTGKLVDGLGGLIRRQGNAIRFDAEVGEILVERGRAAGVVLRSGERIESDIVVSNADAAFTYSTLLRSRPPRRWSPRRLSRARYS